MRRRGRIIAAYVVGISVITATPASGHGGDQILDGQNDVYTLTVQASRADDDSGESVVDLTAYPVRRSNGSPDQAANVSISIDGGPAGELPLAATATSWSSQPTVPRRGASGRSLPLSAAPPAHSPSSEPPSERTTKARAQDGCCLSA